MTIGQFTILWSQEMQFFFDENRYSSIPRPKDITPNTNVQEIYQTNIDQEVDEQTLDKNVAKPSSQPRRSKRARKEKSFGLDFMYIWLKDQGVLYN